MAIDFLKMKNKGSGQVGQQKTGGIDFVNIQSRLPKPQPVAQSEIQKEKPQFQYNPTSIAKETIKNIPSSIAETVFPVIKEIKGISPEEPFAKLSAEQQYKAIAKELPYAAKEVGKQIVNFAVGLPIEFGLDVVSGVKELFGGKPIKEVNLGITTVKPRLDVVKEQQANAKETAKQMGVKSPIAQNILSMILPVITEDFLRVASTAGFAVRTGTFLGKISKFEKIGTVKIPDTQIVQPNKTKLNELIFGKEQIKQYEVPIRDIKNRYGYVSVKKSGKDIKLTLYKPRGIKSSEFLNTQALVKAPTTAPAIIAPKPQSLLPATVGGLDFVKMAQTPKTAITEAITPEVGKVATPEIKAPETSLIQEARKYKSAEEFVKAQGTPVYRGQNSSEFTMVGKSAGIGKSFTTDKNVAGVYGNQGKIIDGFVNNEDILRYGELDGNTKKYIKSIIDEKIDRVKIELGNENIKPFEELVLELGEIARIKNKKAIDISSFGIPSESEIRILSKDALKTKSQLTDIWNKAQEKTKEEIEAEEIFGEALKGAGEKSPELSQEELETQTIQEIYKNEIEKEKVDLTFQDSELEAGYQRFLSAVRDKKIRPFKELIESGDSRRLVDLLVDKGIYKTVKQADEALFSDTGLPNDEALDKYKERILREKPETLIDKETAKTFKGGGGYNYASKDKFAEIDLPDTQTNIQMPEMLKLSKELLGGKIPFLKKYPSAYGMFYSTGDIGLNPEIFKDPNQAVKTLAHEIGHLIDWLPDSIIHGGAGLLGRVMVIKHLRTQIIGQDDIIAKRKKIMATIGRLNNIKKEKKLSIDQITKLVLAKENLQIMNEKLVFNKDLQKELKELTQWWKPFDENKVSAGHKAYRYSSPELYADWISVLFNKPEVLPKMTPKFYQLFFDNLNRKPEVKRAYFELMDFLSGTSDNILRAREIDIEKMFADGEQMFRMKMEQSKQTKKSLWYSIKYNLFDKNIELIEKYNQAEKAGKIKNPEDNIKYLLEENNFVANEVKSIYDKFNTNRKEYLDAGLTDEQFGKVLFLKRVMGDRSGLANPLGQNPHTAEKQLDFLKRQIGNENFNLLEESVKRFNDLYEKEVFDKAYKSGLIKQELYDKIKNSDNIYGTFQTNKHILEGFVSGKVYHQVGTLDDIANPLPATMLKSAAFIRAINTNNTRKEIVKFLTEYYPNEIKIARINHQTGMVKPAPNGMDVLRIKEDGILKAYYVDEYIVKSMDMQTTDFNILVAKTIGWANSSYFRPVYISFNLGFQTFNLMRDFIRTWKAVPNASLYGVAKRYFQSLSESKARALGISNKLIEEMEDNKVFGLTYNDIISGAEDDLSQTERLLQRYNLIPREVKKIRYIQPLLWFFERVKLLGDIIETLPKVVGYKYLKSDKRFTPKDVAHIVRGRIGTPDFTRKGAAYQIYNNLFLFSNIIKEGYRSDYETAFQDPRTRSGYWYKTVKRTIIPKLLMFLAISGYFGKKIKELMDKATEYDKTNYTVVPIGQDKKGNSIYIRIPDDETGRFIGAITWKLLKTINGGNIPSGITDILSYTGGQLPSLSPTIQIPLSGAKMAMGQNPIDNFRQREILTDDEMNAGGWYKWEPYFKWMFNQIGIGTMDVRDRVKDYSLLQQTLNFLPAPLNIPGRWIKVSSYGLSEENQKETQKIKKQESIKRLNKKEAILQQVDKYYKGEKDLDKLFSELDSAVYGGETVTNQQLTSLHKSLIEKIITTANDPNINSIIYATTNEQKINLIKKIKAENKPEEVNRIGQILISAKIISVETWNKGME